jgi:thermostable 8-oxoguanine DNA glycosylase
MKIIWEIDYNDVKNLNDFCNIYNKTDFYIRRQERNIRKENLNLSRDYIWKAMVTCLLTTQQNSSSNSPISNFIRQTPFPLELDVCKTKNDLKSFVAKTISSFGQIRRNLTIADELETNYKELEKSNWQLFDAIISNLNRPATESFSQIENERMNAEMIVEHLKGFGPKQSRNLLQILGLTMYEIPIDSRIIKWLTNFGFPFKISSIGLQDKNYYNFILDAIQNLCEQSKVIPCLLDAAIFENGDKGQWKKSNLVF